MVVMTSFNSPMTVLNPRMNTVPACAAPAAAGAPAPRRLPAGLGLGLAALMSLTLWAGLAHAVGALIA